MTFEENIKRIFMMSSKEFKKKYSFTNKFLFVNLKIDEKEKMIKNLIKITSCSLEYKQDEIVSDIIESPFSSSHNGNIDDEYIFFSDDSSNKII